MASDLPPCESPAAAWNARLKAQASARRDELAEHVSVHGNISRAAREMGVSQQRASQMWRIIRSGLGWQAQ
jgi:molybdenum-dependent DNA-binding transcriptional regulator ModE